MWTQHKRYPTGKICLLATLWQQTKNSKPGLQTLEVMLKMVWCSGNGLCLHGSRLMSVKILSMTELEGYGAGYSQWDICNLFLMWDLLRADLLQRICLMVSTKLPVTILQVLIHWLLQIFYFFFFWSTNLQLSHYSHRKVSYRFLLWSMKTQQHFPTEILKEKKKAYLTMATKFPLSHIHELIWFFCCWNITKTFSLQLKA